MRTTLRRICLAFVAGAVLGVISTASGPVWAQAQVPPDMKAQAMAMARLCRADFDRLCPGVQPGGGRILACLQQRASELSPQCRNAMPKAEALKAKASEAGVLPK